MKRLNQKKENQDNVVESFDYFILKYIDKDVIAFIMYYLIFMGIHKNITKNLVKKLLMMI